MAIDLTRQNDRVIDWANRSVGRMKSGGNALGIVHRSNSPSPGSSLDKIADKFRYKDGVIEVISFRFPRSLVWPHKGAGKGMGGSKGSTWTDQQGNRHTTKASSFGKAGTGSRRPKPWFNQAVEGATGVEELATIVAEETGDAISNNLLIK
jgi:hypothetical protein